MTNTKEEKEIVKCDKCEEEGKYVIQDGKDTHHYCKKHAEAYYKKFIYN